MTLPYENSTSGERALGEWTVLERTGRKWLCRCSCGRESLVDKYQLRNGGSTRCKSCANKGRAFTHGQAGGAPKSWSKKYRTWNAIKRRVADQKSPRSRWYFGVPFHPEWADFSVFDRDVPEPPSDDLTIDRIDNAKGYVPGNLRWVTQAEQARNRRSNALYSDGARVQCLAAWAAELDINEATLRYRIGRGQTVLERIQSDNLLPAPKE